MGQNVIKKYVTFELRKAMINYKQPFKGAPFFL